MKDTDIRLCIWCGNEVEHSFDIPLCVACLVRIHFETTSKDFDANQVLQDYLKEKRGRKSKRAKSKVTTHTPGS